MDILVPVSQAAAVVLGRWGSIGFSIAAVVAIVGSANAGIMAASRYPLALARDEMLPGALTGVNRRFQTPHGSILLTGVVIIVALFFDITILIKAASSILILASIVTCLAVIILRESRVQNYRPAFYCPLYPWIQLLGIIGLGILLFEIGMAALLVTCFLGLAGFMVYWFYGRKKASRE